MSRLVSEASKYFNWWTSTLVSCVPGNLVSFYRKFNRPFDYVIAHQGETVFIQDASGRIIESRSESTSIVKASADETPDIDFDIGAVDDDDPSGENQILNIGATPPDQDITEQTEVVRQLFGTNNNNDLQHTVFDNTLTDENTLVFNREDNTTRLVDLVKDQDTVIIDDDQGTLLTKTQTAVAAKDTTVLYMSDQGKIRPVDPGTAHSEEETNVDFLLNEAEETEEGGATNAQFNLAASLARQHQGKKRCLYLLPDERVFSLQLSYPIQALENIENVLRFDLEKHIPLSFHEVRFFYALNVSPAQDTVEVDTVVIKTEDYDALQNAFAFDSSHSVVCTTQRFLQNYGVKINFLDRKRSDARNSWLNACNIHNLLNVVLLLTLLAVPYLMYQQAENRMQTVGADELKKVSSIVTTINQLNAESVMAAELSAELESRQRMIVLLATLSEVIDTDAWITRLSYKNGDIKIKGEAVSATTVSDNLNRSGLFENIKFVSSIVKNPKTQKESFELSMKVKNDA
jgi:general secretion pathway protein L